MFCPSCGEENPKAAEKCSECGASLLPETMVVKTMGQAKSEAPSIEKAVPKEPAKLETPPPETVDSNERTVAGSRIARIGDRFLAVVLDALMISAVFAVVGSSVASRFGGLTSSGFSMTGRPALLAIGATVVFSFIYYWFFEALLGGTLGKLILGIKVRDLSGGPCSLSQSFVRNLLRIIDGIAVYFLGFLIAIFSKYRQRLGDHAAKTVVVEKTSGTPLTIFLVLIWLAAIACSIWGAYVIHQGTFLKTSVAVLGQTVQKAPETPLPAGGIRASGQLKITDFQFTDGEKGPLRATASFKPGEKVFSQYHIIGYTTDNQGQINLEGQVTITDPNNVLMLSSNFPIREKMIGNNPVRGWINFNVVYYSPPGNYNINIKIRDTINNGYAEFVVPFNVTAPPPVISGGLNLRDLQLSLIENGPPVSSPVIQEGGKIFTSAKLAGMQFKDRAVHCKIAFKLFGPSGELLLDKPDFAEVKDSFDYLPSSFYLPLTANVTAPLGRKGVFTEQFLVTDLYGNSSRTFSAKFTVR